VGAGRGKGKQRAGSNTERTASARGAVNVQCHQVTRNTGGTSRSYSDRGGPAAGVGACG
jgi:hypothetical protein